MKVDIAKWTPQPGEQVSLVGLGKHGDFASVQRVIEVTGDTTEVTGGWVFTYQDGDWIHRTRTIVMRCAPQLNADILYPMSI